MQKGSFNVSAGRISHSIDNDVIEVVPVPYEMTVFSGGELHIRLANPYGDQFMGSTNVFAHLKNSQDIMELFILMNALDNARYPIQGKLTIPYFPYARMDRVSEPGGYHGAKLMSMLINGLRFDKVEVWDVHSDVSLAVINNVENIGPEVFLTTLPLDKRTCVLVAPDVGASKKTGKVAKEFGMPWVQATKVRDPSTGGITGTKVDSEHIGDKNFLIVDDICDGGRTFIELAKILRPLTNGKVYLYVTHAIMSKGIDMMEGIDHIYTACPFPNVDLSHPKITKLLTST